MLKIIIHKSFNASYHFNLVKFWWKIAKKPNATEKYLIWLEPKFYVEYTLFL